MRMFNACRMFAAFVVCLLCGLSTAEITVINSTECGDGVGTMWATWNVWTPLGPCSTNCLSETGEASRQRTRMCPERVDGCDADQFEVEYYRCMGTDPPQDGSYGQWTPWQPQGDCSALCGNGFETEERTRECDSPPATCGGLDCFGRNSQTRRVPCNLGSCGRLCRRNRPPLVLLSRAVPGSYLLCRQGSVIAIPCPSFANFNQFFLWGYQNAIRIFRVCF